MKKPAICFKLSADERRAIEAAADRLDLSLSEFVRGAAVDAADRALNWFTEPERDLEAANQFVADVQAAMFKLGKLTDDQTP